MERRLAAILSYDVVGYSHAIEKDEAATLEGLRIHRSDIIEPAVERCSGRIVKFTGDGGLVEFLSVIDAVSFALHMQSGIPTFNRNLPEGQQLAYRIGINVGDVVVENGDVYGDGVNIAVRIEALAEPGEICVDRSVRDQLAGRLDLSLEDLGEVAVKNIDRPVHAFKVIRDEKANAVPLASATPRKVWSPTRWRLTIAAAVAVVLIGAIGWWQMSRPEFEPVEPAEMSEALPDKPSIAVLALDDLSTGVDKEYLSDALSEGIITALSRFPDLFVIARNSSFYYRDNAVDVREIAKELGVRYILEGSQQKAGDRLRVTVQLIDAVAGNHVWAETYDRELVDIFTVQDEIADTVASTLGEKLIRIGGEEAKRADPARLNAFQHFMAGVRHFREFTREGNEQARLSYLRAIEADPDLVQGHSGLAWVYINGYRWGWTELDRNAALARAREHAKIAIELDPNDYNGHFVMAYVHIQAGEREQATVELEKSLDLVPNAGNVMATLAEVLGYSERMPEAIDLIEKAMRLDPHHPEWFYWNLGWAQYSVGNCETALATLRKMSRMPPLANRILAATYVCLGQLDNASAAIKALLEHDPEYSIGKFRLNFEGKYKDPAKLEAWIDDLRTAGLPE